FYAVAPQQINGRYRMKTSISLGGFRKLLACLLLAPTFSSASAKDIIGLVLATETSPVDVSMRKAAEDKVQGLGYTLYTAAGKYDGDNDGQVAAIENLISA